MSKESSKAALIGKAGEALVAAELLRQGIDVAYPPTMVAWTCWLIVSMTSIALCPSR